MTTPDSGWNSNGCLTVVAAAAGFSALSQGLRPGWASMLKLWWRAAAGALFFAQRLDSCSGCWV